MIKGRKYFCLLHWDYKKAESDFQTFFWQFQYNRKKEYSAREYAAQSYLSDGLQCGVNVNNRNINYFALGSFQPAKTFQIPSTFLFCDIQTIRYILLLGLTANLKNNLWFVGSCDKIPIKASSFPRRSFKSTSSNWFCRRISIFSLAMIFVLEKVALGKTDSNYIIKINQ